MKNAEEIQDNPKEEEQNDKNQLQDVKDLFLVDALRQNISSWSKWRQAPRDPSNFLDHKASVSSCHDSDYEAWLDVYYEDLCQTEKTSINFDKATEVPNLGEEPVVRKSPVLSLFSYPSPDERTKYWGPKDQRRHWPLAKTEKEIRLFPSTYPRLNASSRYGKYIFSINAASAIKNIEYTKIVSSFFKLNLIRAKIRSYQVTQLILCDELLPLSIYDVVTKKVIITALCQYLRKQRYLEKVSFENAQLQQLEGIVLLCALSKNAGDVLKELHIWKMFARGQCPVLRDTLSLRAQSKSSKYGDLDLRFHFLEILNDFTKITHLSVNYAYLANPKGDALLGFKPIQNGCLEELRLLCLPEERPLCVNPNFGVGGYQIPDGVWRKAKELDPKLRVMVVFINMPEYENIILFLSKSIPLASFYVSSGIEVTFRKPWEIDTTLLELRNWYSTTLHTLCLHFWHHRDLLDYVIEYKLLEEFPNLLTFEFIGILKSLTTLEGLCKRLMTRKYKLKRLLFWVQEVYSDQKKHKKTQAMVQDINERYFQQLQNIDIDVHIKLHPI